MGLISGWRIGISHALKMKIKKGERKKLKRGKRRAFYSYLVQGHCLCYGSRPLSHWTTRKVLSILLFPTSSLRLWGKLLEWLLLGISLVQHPHPLLHGSPSTLLGASDLRYMLGREQSQGWHSMSNMYLWINRNILQACSQNVNVS